MFFQITQKIPNSCKKFCGQGLTKNAQSGRTGWWWPQWYFIFYLPGLGDGGGLRGGFDETVVDVIKGVNFEGVAGADWFSSGTLSRMVLAFSSWTSLENFSKID